MRRFFEPSLSQGQEHISIEDAEEFHHLVHVLRLKPNDTFELGNGKGLVAVAKVTGISHHSLEVRILSESLFPLPTYKVTLACAIPKKAKFESIIEKATELGVDEIIPLVTDRTEAIGKSSEWAKKDERFLKAAIEAAKQCRRPWLPLIRPVMRFSKALEALGRLQDTLIFIPWLEGARPLLGDALKTSKGKNLVFLIGPEGDFTPEEVALAKAKGAVPISLGENVLKVDTAAFYVTALAKSIDIHT